MAFSIHQLCKNALVAELHQVTRVAEGHNKPSSLA
jgi:hypothetical protein